MTQSNGVQRVVVLGGGFAGASLAIKLAANQKLDVTLINRWQYIAETLP